MSRWTSYKRWRLREGVPVADVLALVRDGIEPHYSRLDPAVRLGLQRLGSGDLLALQHWPDRTHRDRAMSGPAFECWWDDYRPLLQRWDALVELVDEEDGEELLER